MVIFVGMSGGIDSTVSAWILKNMGYEVVGIHAVFIDEHGQIDIKVLEDLLKIDIVKVDLTREFEEKVINYFVDEYLNGRTPNPCAICNREIKFGILRKIAFDMGADLFATGHYVKLIKSNNQLVLMKAKDKDKDQSYFLSLVEAKKLEKVVFPLGEILRSEVEKIAIKIGLDQNKIKSSKDLCFVQKDYRELIEKYGFTTKCGFFLDKHGNILGRHEGVHRYTIGQRKGLKLFTGRPMYVKKIDKDGNITLATRDEMFSKVFTVKESNWFLKIEYPLNCSCKIRYKAHEKAARVEKLDETCHKVVLDEPAFAVTPGQICAFYAGDTVIGGAIIKEVQDGEKYTT